LGFLGKIIGAAVGLAIGSWIGAVIGAVAGHVYDLHRAQQQRHRGRDRQRTPPRDDRPWPEESPPEAGPTPIIGDPEERRRIAFATAVIVLGAKLSKVDGVVTRDEIRAFKRIFQIADKDVGDVGRIFNRAKTTARGFEPYARQVAGLFGNDPYLLEELLIGLFEVARADGELNPAEIDFLRRVAAIFGFDVIAFEQVRARYSATARNMSGADDAYAVLGLDRSTSDDQIKQTYRKLVREHHPDRLVSKGLPQDMVERANQTLASINAAYDRIAKERNLR
jgi:DnaJ like chaperone protein